MKIRFLYIFFLAFCFSVQLLGQCPAVEASSVVVNDTFAVKAQIAWLPTNDAGYYYIEYDSTGFVQGTGDFRDSTLENTHILTNLTEKTVYDFYISQVCVNGDTSLVVGPFTFETLWKNDVGIVGITMPNADLKCNFSALDTIEVQIENFGADPQSLIPFNYRVNNTLGGVDFLTDGFYTGIVGKDSIEYIQFDEMVDLSQPGLYEISAWTGLEADSMPENDTFRMEFIYAYPLPFYEDFEPQVFNETWTSDETNPIYPPNHHGNENAVIADNLSNTDNLFELSTTRYGIIKALDSLSFDYRYVQAAAGNMAQNLSAADSLIVQISVDCEETFETLLKIDVNNHTSSSNFANISIPLDAYEGEIAQFRFLGYWGAANYWLDLDNIHIYTCREDILALTTITTGESTFGASNGTATVKATGGFPPYTYDWNTGDTTQTISELTVGIYQVVVSDSRGCSNTTLAGIFLTNTSEIEIIESIHISPNPTQGFTQVEATLQHSTTAQLSVVNMLGQTLWEKDFKNTSTISEQIDLQAYAAGIYFIKINTAEGQHVEKIMLQ